MRRRLDGRDWLFYFLLVSSLTVIYVLVYTGVVIFDCIVTGSDFIPVISIDVMMTIIAASLFTGFTIASCSFFPIMLCD